MTSERLQTTESAKKQGYKNPFTGNVKISFVDNQPQRNLAEKFRDFVRFPIKLSPEETQVAWDKMVKDEAEELWGPEEGDD